VKHLNLDVIPAAQALTLPGLLERRCERTPRAEGYRQYDEQAGRWRSYTWSEMRALVRRWRSSLSNGGLAPGERVAILLRNSVEWVCFDLAAQALGLIVVPLYTSDSPGNIAHVLADSGARLLFVGSAGQWSPLAPLRSRFPALTQVLCLANKHPQNLESGLSWRVVAAWLAGDGNEFEIHARDPNAIATLTYTSGTTGPPKGVMLSHANILANAEAVLAKVPLYREDLCLSFLPLSHAFERTAGYYVPMMGGSCVAFARSVEHLAEDLQHVRPTVLISVPRIYERAYARMQEELGRRPKAMQRLVRWTAELGWRRFEALQGRGKCLSVGQRLLCVVLQWLVARQIRDKLGGRLRVCVSGGAALASEPSRWFIGMGLPLLQGYGLTEAAPVVSGNTATDNQPSSVGTALPGVELRLGAGDEVLVKGPGVMRGYWNRPEDTSKVLDADGWLHTGDIGRLEMGHLYITGRIKEILVLSTAEKVAPVDLEMAITGDPLFEQAMVLGEGKPYLCALLVVNQHAWGHLCASLGLAPEDPNALASAAAAKAALDRVAARLEPFPTYARVRKVWLRREPWTIEADLITPTMKLKREALARQFKDPIEALYRDAG
jgi:long-chain acyl-CoA synthetase